MATFYTHAEYNRIFGYMFLHKVMSSVLKQVLTQFKKNFKSGDIDVSTFKKYIRTEIIVDATLKTVVGYLYIDTQALQANEETPASASGGVWARYSFTFNASEAYDFDQAKGDNTINEKYISWQMIRWLEKGMRLNPDASYRGNMAQWVRRPAPNGKGTKWVAIPKPWRKVGMFEKTYNYVKTNYADILQRAFKAAGCEVKGVPNGQPKVRRN